jgi:rhamnosyltransferase subunit B
MARIVLSTFGSMGDLNPFIALGFELRARGHKAIFALEEMFHARVASLGFEVAPLSGDAEAALRPYAKEMFGSASTLTSVRALVDHYIVPTLRAKVADLQHACDGAAMLVASPQHQAASIVATLTHVPWVTLTPLPSSIPSAYSAPQPLPFRLPSSMQRIANQAMWSLGLAMMARIVDRPINTVRAEYGLKPGRRLLNTGNLSPRLTMLAVSPSVIPPAPDWPAYVAVTGFCFWDAAEEWQPDNELIAYFDQPVVAISSGSMSAYVDGAFERFFTTSIEAARLARLRPLVVGTMNGSLPAGVMALPYIPFSWLYPRCAVAIHHGGIGTVAQALRAGVPALVVPWGADQFFNAALVESLSTSATLNRAQYTAERAAASLLRLVGMKDNGQLRRIKDLLAGEDGVCTACDAIETSLASC